MQIPIRSTKGIDSETGDLKRWITNEVKACAFPDERLSRRFGNLLGMISRRVGDTIPAACQDWANTKAAYRFLSNPRVSEHDILEGHFQATAARSSASCAVRSSSQKQTARAATVNTPTTPRAPRSCLIHSTSAWAVSWTECLSRQRNPRLWRPPTSLPWAMWRRDAPPRCRPVFPWVKPHRGAPKSECLSLTELRS